MRPKMLVMCAVTVFSLMASRRRGWRKAHLANLFARHGFKDRVQAAMWAREHGVGET
jgi:hypothetical protein